jgi:hypothetical protein
MSSNANSRSTTCITEGVAAADADADAAAAADDDDDDVDSGTADAATRSGDPAAKALVRSVGASCP